MATYADAKWNRMDAPMNEFMPVELTSQEFAQLCNQMGGIPDILFNSKGNTTYNNYETALKVFYINCLQPIMSNILDTISLDLKLPAKNELLEPDYSEIECLNETSLDKIIYLFNSNIITKNQVLELMGMPESSNPSFNEITNGQTTATQAIDGNQGND
jgi:phage portal protein BeeE